MTLQDQKQLVSHQARLGMALQGTEELDEALQQLLINDLDIKVLLKGQLMDKFEHVKLFVEQLIPDGTLTPDKLFELNNLVDEVLTVLKPYSKLVPYILMMTHLNSLGYITEKQAKIFTIEGQLMLLHDLALMTPEEYSVSRNLYRAMAVRMEFVFFDSVGGAKFKQLTSPTKTVLLGEGPISQPKKKHFWNFL
jgi:hypothetical protein